MGTGVGSTGALATSGGSANILNGVITLAGTTQITATTSSDSLSLAAITGAGFGLTLNGAGSFSQTGGFSGTNSSLTASGSGTLNLSQANSYTGATQLAMAPSQLAISQALVITLTAQAASQSLLAVHLILIMLH